MKKSPSKIFIKSFYKASTLSYSSYELCVANRFRTIADLQEYLIKEGTFENLVNCKPESNKELIRLSHNYLDLVSLKLKGENNSSQNFPSDLSTEQLATINAYILYQIDFLKVRPRNALTKILKENPLEDLFNIGLFQEDFDPLLIENIGISSVQDILAFKKQVEDCLQDIAGDTNPVSLNLRKLKIKLEAEYGLKNWPEKIENSESVFKWLEHLLYNNCFSIARDTKILLQTLNLNHEYQYEALDELPQVLGLTRQRTEQIRDKQLKDLPKKLQILTNVEENLFNRYGFEPGVDFHFINHPDVDKINKINNTSFSQPFLTVLVGNYLPNLAVVGSIKDTLIPKMVKSKSIHYWNNLYLLDAKLSSKFDFLGFANDLHKRLNRKIEEDYYLNFLSYVAAYFKGSQSEDLDRLLSICNSIIQNEFEDVQIVNNRLMFKRTTPKLIYEYAYEALTELDEASDAETIEKVLAQKYPDLDLTKEALRNAMRRNDIFKVVGNQSTYGLTKWEKEKEDFKGGFFKDIVSEYLERNSDPVHMLELIREISKFRDTPTTKSLRVVLTVDPDDTFKIFNQNFVGLKNRDYSGNTLTTLPVQLGKSIVSYINKNPGTKISDLATYWCNILNISKKNCIHILNHLIESEFISTDENQQVYKKQRTSSLTTVNA